MSMKGLEPSWIAPLEPKPSAYTNSATSTWERELELNQQPEAYETSMQPLHFPAKWIVSAHHPQKTLSAIFSLH